MSDDQVLRLTPKDADPELLRQAAEYLGVSEQDLLDDPGCCEITDGEDVVGVALLRPEPPA